MREAIRFRRFTNAKGEVMFVNMEKVLRVWFDEEKQQTAIMYDGGFTDHVKESLREVLYGKDV